MAKNQSWYAQNHNVSKEYFQKIVLSIWYVSKYDTCIVRNILSDLGEKTTFFKHDIMLNIIYFDRTLYRSKSHNIIL